MFIASSIDWETEQISHKNIELSFGLPLLQIYAYQNILYKMRRKSIKQNSGELQDDDGTEGNAKEDKEKRAVDEYKCGKAECAFYNHCKKSHDGVFPPNSIYNGKTFEGPSKNRGRPRIKKTDAKDSVQIESLKTENELIEFLGTLQKRKKNEELIVYVANPIQQLQNAIQEMNAFKMEHNSMFSGFINDLLQMNRIVSKHDLPDFYDPIEIHNFADKMDSYNYLSIYNFLSDPTKAHLHGSPTPDMHFMRKIMIIWLTRILSVPLLAEVIYTVAQVDEGFEKIDEKEYLMGKTGKFRQLMEKYFQCIVNEQSSVGATGRAIDSFRDEDNQI